MSAATIEHSELSDVHRSNVSEQPSETINEPSLLATREASDNTEHVEDESNYKDEEVDCNAPVRSVVIGEDDEEDGQLSSGTNAQEEVDPYKDYETFLYDHDYTGMFRPSHIPKMAEEGHDSISFPVMAGLSSHFGADEDFDEPQNWGSRNIVYSGEGSSSLYRFREIQPRQGETPVERNHGVYPTTSYRVSSNSVVYGGKTYLRYSSLGGSQTFRTPIRDSYAATPSSPRTVNSFGNARRISFSGSGIGSIQQRKGIRPRIGDRAYEQPGLRVMPSPIKQYGSESSTFYQSNTASIVADPMRAANDNAPAPFIVPARGSRPSLRGKGQANRSQQVKPKSQEGDEKQLHPTGHKIVCGLVQKNENVMQVGTMHGQHPGRIYEQQMVLSGSDKKYIANALVEPNPVSHSEFICHPYQNAEERSRLNISTDGSPQNARPNVAMEIESKHLRAESPVTSIVESAHREAVRRASESGQTGETISSVKMLTQNVQDLQHAGFPVNENDQAFDGGQQTHFQNYIPYEQQPMEYYTEGSQEQYAAPAEPSYFVEENQRHPIDDSFVSPHPQRRRMSSRSSAYPAFIETSSRVTEPLQGRIPPQSPLASRGLRQIPISPSHAVGGLSQTEEKLVSHESHLPMQSPVVQTVASQQQRIQLVSSVTSTSTAVNHSEDVARASEQYPVQPQLQHAQLSSPEQQLAVPEQQYVSPLLPEHISGGQNMNGQRSFNYILTTPDGSEAFTSPIGQPPFGNEEASSGDELAMGDGARGQSYVARQAPNFTMRSSISAAEEEISFAEDPSEERGTEEEEQRTQKIDKPSGEKLDEYDGWSEGDEYTTRCYCTMNHNDDFMIQCDVCNVWQHMVCVGIDRSRVPKVYKCEICNPRLLKLSVAEAKAIQMKFLEMKKRRKFSKTRTKKVEQKTRKKILSKMKERKSFLDESTKKFVETTTYDYSRAVAAFAKRQSDTGDIAIIDSIKNNETVRVMYVAQDSEGLVSTRSIRKGDPVVFVCGRLCLPSECPGREKPGSVTQFVMLYMIHLEEQGSVPVAVCIDARRTGSTARFARRSCKPNVKLQHIFNSGKLYIFGVATEDVERGDEVTFPFDPDYELAKKKLVCACAPDDENVGVDNCEIRKLMSTLEDQSGVLQKIDIENPVVGRKPSKSVVKHKKLGRNKSNRNVKATLEADDSESQQSLQFESSDKKPAGKDTSSPSLCPSASVAMAVTDEEGNNLDVNSVSSSVKDFGFDEKEIGKGEPKAIILQKAESAALKVASQRKKGVIKLKRTRKASLKNKGASRKKPSKIDEGQGNGIGVQKVTDKVADVVSPPRKYTRSMSAAEAATSIVQPVKAKTSEEEKSNGNDEKVTLVGNSLAENGKQEALKNEARNESGSIVNDNKIETNEVVKTEGPEVVSTGTILAPRIKAINSKKQPKREVEVAVKEDEISMNICDPSGFLLLGKHKTKFDKSGVRTLKRVKEESDLKDAGADQNVTEDKKDMDTSLRKISHHRRELPEVELMNYMLPGDRNKAETREERKMKQQLALFERMQKEKKRKEERRLHRSETLGISQLSEKSKSAEKEFEGEETPTAGDNVESEEAAKSSLILSTRRSARVSERDQDKNKVDDNFVLFRDADFNNVRAEVERASPSSVSPSQHPALLTAPRKRWAAAARSDSAENIASTAIGLQSPALFGQKAYLLRRVEQQAAASKDQEKADESIGNQQPEKVELDASSPKKRRGVEAAPPEEIKQEPIAVKNFAEIAEPISVVKQERVSLQSVALAEISEMTREIAQCYARICALTSALGTSDFTLPSGDFFLKDLKSDKHFSPTKTLSSASASSSKTLSSSPGRKPLKKKMSLDEYKKRRETTSNGREEKNEECASSSKSFIPTIKDSKLEAVSRRSSLRLGSIPDPAQLRDAPTASLDDLKRRIYGKQSGSTPSHSPKMSFSSVNIPRGRTPPEFPENASNSASSQRKRTTPPPPPPPPTEWAKSEPKEARLPLEERLQMLLGGTDPESLTSASVVLRPPPPPPPPSLPPTSTLTRGSSRKIEISLLPSSVRGRTPPPPLYGSSGSSGRSRRH